MKILICGGRDYNNWLKFCEVMSEYFAWDRYDLELISGGARGADSLAEQWAKEYGVIITVFPADWKTYGTRAGYLRNVLMADQNPDLVIAFPGSKGTAMMVKIARERGIEVQEVS